MTKTVKSERLLQNIRKKQAAEMKSMTAKEKDTYVRSKSKQCQNRIKELIKQNLPRYQQVLIRLTEAERKLLEQEAAKNHITMSTFIRNRVFGVPSPLDTIAERLDRIETLLKR